MGLRKGISFRFVSPQIGLGFTNLRGTLPSKIRRSTPPPLPPRLSDMVGAGQGKLILLLDVAAAELAAAAIVVAVAVDFTPVLRNHFLCFLLPFFFFKVQCKIGVRIILGHAFWAGK